ncbi:MAG: glycoside hydrolase family 43 protein [Clostridia bacterium]|nr:glycoside hydrolase family 43 protein [Clostridia bacterium]
MTRKTKSLISVFLSIILLCSIIISSIVLFSGCEKAVEGKDGYYLFCYFVGNKPEEETVHFAISNDGYNFSPLNDNKAVIEQTKGTLSSRDPFIFRANDKYYIIATDMKSDLGWNSNYSMVIWESTDLINWTNERIINIREHEGFEHSCRVWAPEVIYDSEVNKYMVYWANCLDTDWKTYMVYAYLNDDFTDVGEIKTLYQSASGHDAIDGDIVYVNDTYYLYFKDENEKRIKYVTSKNVTGPYVESENMDVTTTNKDVEGCCTYNIVGTDTYVMIMDQYDKNKYYMQSTTKDSMVEFKQVRSTDYNFKFSPRHGSMLIISKEEYERLSSATW